MSLQRARSAEEYVEWVKQAVFEVDDLRDCYDYQMEEMGRYPSFLEPLEEGIKALHRQMQEGEYHFGREDLSFMPLVTAMARIFPLPFYYGRSTKHTARA
jgi:hypothetical protein